MLRTVPAEFLAIYPVLLPGTQASEASLSGFGGLSH